MAVSETQIEAAKNAVRETMVNWGERFPKLEYVEAVASAALTAALSDQVVGAEKELTLVRSQLAECHKEIFKLREALVSASTPVRSS